jgi:glycosyltransferase involved in cell wall biosynthesis
MPGSAVRVLRVITRLNVGGPARHVAILDEGLQRLGYDTLTVHGSLARGEGSLEELFTVRGLPHRYLPALGRRMQPISDLMVVRDLARIMRQLQPDIVHTHMAKAGAVGRLAARAHNLTRPSGSRCVIVHTFHGHVMAGHFGPAASTAVRLAERTLAAVTDRVVAISERQRDDLTRRFRVAPAARTRVVPLGLELDELFELPRPTPRGSGLTVAFVGRLAPVKDIPTLLRAFAAAAPRLPGAALQLIGDGPLRAELQALAASLGIASRVLFAGWRHDLANVYGASDVVVLTSRSEGTPVALIEALAAGRPVIATAVGGVPDVVQHGVSGLLVPAGDPDAFSEALVHLASRPDERVAMGERGRAFVRSRHTAARLVADHDAMYRELLAGRQLTRAVSGQPASAHGGTMGWH